MEKIQYQAQGSTPKKPLKLDTILKSVNLAEELDEDYLQQLGVLVVNGYDTDDQTRTEWKERNADALKMALQIVEEKSFPWQNAASVKMPLLTIGLMQFIARIELLTNPEQIVHCEVRGVQAPEFTAAAERISNHMSYQLLDADPQWLNDDELAKVVAALLGCSFKKTYFDDVARQVRSVVVNPANLVVSYQTKDLETCPRISELIMVSANTIQAGIYAGKYRKVELTAIGPNARSGNVLATTADMRQGLSDQGDYGTMFYALIEQYISLDLDGDGIAEPYIVTVEKDSGMVLRVVANFYAEDIVRCYDAQQQEAQYNLDTLPRSASPEQHAYYAGLVEQVRTNPQNHILHIKPQQYFTKFTFMPSPDCGFYGLGLGSLLRPINSTVNSGINQLLDAGTMAVTAGGFLGRGIRIKSGTASFAPNEWKIVDSTGDDLRKSIVPLPVREPSAIMFQLVSMLMEYGERIVGATDIMTGVSPGQNTPAETSRNTIEQGMKVFSNIFRRMWRSQREEFKKIFEINKLFLPQMKDYRDITQGTTALVSPEDYMIRAVRITPAADPSAASSTQLTMKNQQLVGLADSHPGLYKVREAHKKLLISMGYRDIEAILPDPQGQNAIPPVPNPKIELEKAQLQLEAQKLNAELMFKAAELQLQANLNNAKIAELMAKAEKLEAEAESVGNGHQIALLNTEIGAAKTHQEGILRTVELMQKMAETKLKLLDKGDGNAGQSGSGNDGQTRSTAG